MVNAGASAPSAKHVLRGFGYPACEPSEVRENRGCARQPGRVTSPQRECPRRRTSMPTRDVVVVAASAGGLEALQALLAGLPGDYAGVLLVVSHIPAQSGDALPKILDRATSLPVANARHGERLRGGHVYVASPDHHLLVGDGHLHVRRGPRENGHRPAADPLFRSAALHFGPRVVGVVLSGTLSDGAAGLVAVRRQGGVTVVQDPGDALFNGMPLSALEAVAVDHVLAAAQMGPLLAALALEDVSSRVAEPDATMRQEVSLMEGNHE